MAGRRQVTRGAQTLTVADLHDQVTQQPSESGITEKLTRIATLMGFVKRETEEYQKRILSANLELTTLQKEVEDYMKANKLDKLENDAALATLETKTTTSKEVDIQKFLTFLKTKKLIQSLADYIKVPVTKLCKDFGETALSLEKVITYDTAEKQVFDVKAKV